MKGIRAASTVEGYAQGSGHSCSSNRSLLGPHILDALGSRTTQREVYSFDKAHHFADLCITIPAFGRSANQVYQQA
jgi:hypothetical protein